MSIKKSYSDDELNSLIADVAKEFSTQIAKAEETLGLKKSEDMPPKKDESKEKDEAKASEESKGESKKPMESEKPEDKGMKDQNQQADDKAGKDDQAQPGQAGKEQKAPMAAEGQDHNYDDEDMQHMHSMYSSMSPGELKAHHDSIRKCMDGNGMAKCEDGMMKAEMEDGKEGEHRPNGGPSDGEAAKCKTPPSSDAQAMTKSEKNVAIEIPQEVSLLKSELEAARADADKSKKEVAAVADFLKKFVEKTAPAGKAITSLDIIAKTEGSTEEKPLQKSEIDARLTAKAKDLTLSKSDREAINSYYCGSKDIKKVSHLLK
jgi:hypothetical protein